jgi:hypothetical protein
MIPPDGEAHWNLDDVALLVTRTQRQVDNHEFTDALHSIDHAVWYAEEARRNVVAAMRAVGETWTTIGTVLDVSRQSAEQRFGDHVRRKLGTNETTDRQLAAPVPVDDGQEGTFTCPKCGRVQFILDGLHDAEADAEVCQACA